MRRRLLRLTSAVLVTLVGLALLGVAATGAAPVTDYANYPANAGVPEACDASGVLGVSYDNVTSGVGPVTDFQTLPIAQGDVVRVSWTGNSEACTGALFTLSLKDAPGPAFDFFADQALVAYVQTTLTGGPGSLELAMVLVTGGCHYQADPHLGEPLQVVGPSGSYYGAIRGFGPNLLVGAKNGTLLPCAQVTTTSSTSTSSPTTTEPTTTVPDTSTSTSLPSTTTEPPPSSTTFVASTLVTATSAVATLPSEPGRVEAAAARLPATGRPSGLLATVGAVLLAAGVLLLLRARRLA